MRGFLQMRIEKKISMGLENLSKLQRINCPVLKVPIYGCLEKPCGKYIFSFPDDLNATNLKSGSDFVLADEWLGDGGLAFNQILVSEKFKELYEIEGWRGLEINSVWKIRGGKESAN